MLMNEEHKYIDFESYKRVAEPHKRERASAWRTAIGLQDVDGLRVSEYLKETAVKHIEGDITIDEAKVLIDSYYKSADGRKSVENDRTEEADKVSARITEILAEKTFSFTPAQLTSIHRRLFDGIYKLSGHIRDYNITKNEWVLGGKTVYYASADTISDTLDYDMGQEREYSYEGMNVDDAIRHLSRFCANLWQIHPFCEGNTRTTAVFMIKYLRSLGFNLVNDVFANNSWYFRNALVRANYRDLPKGITETIVYLERFFRSMLLGEQHDLRNRIMHVDWGKAEGCAVQSAKPDLQSANASKELSLKCKNCTLEEAAVLRIVQKNPTVTQKEIAAEIGKSERTVKTITVNLQEKGILQRVNGKRNGRWEITDERES
ncbi:MAG: Fic family protein [Paludibacteraceae bacterium]|nr:Fic family protein [Paludibacteraceae bacterium]